jgi:hypothetical protein
MTTPIIFPDLELWATGYLRTTLASYGYPGMHVDNKRGTEVTAVWVRRDGGSQLDTVREAPRLGVNVFAPTEQKVADLARTVSALLVAAPDGAPVLKVTQTSGPSPIADASGPRRFMTFEVLVRGAELAPTP